MESSEFNLSSEVNFLERFNGDIENPQWDIDRTTTILVGVYGFTAVTVHYDHFLGRGNKQIMFIFGGMTDDDVVNEDVFFVNGQGWMQKHPQKFLQYRRDHRSGVRCKLG